MPFDMELPLSYKEVVLVVSWIPVRNKRDECRVIPNSDRHYRQRPNNSGQPAVDGVCDEEYGENHLVMSSIQADCAVVAEEESGEVSSDSIVVANVEDSVTCIRTKSRTQQGKLLLLRMQQRKIQNHSRSRRP